MFSAIKDFIMGTAIMPFEDGTSWARTLGWAGAIVGVIGILATGNAGFLLLMPGGVIAGGAAGIAFGLITGGVRGVIEHEGAARPSREQKQAQHQTEVQQHRMQDHERYQQQMDDKVMADMRQERKAANKQDGSIVGHHTAALHASREALESIPEIGGK